MLTRVCYDLEFIGNLNEDVGQCRVYEIAAVKESGETFHSFVDPGEPYDDPVVGTLPLDSVRGARTLQEVVDALFEWVFHGSAGCTCVLISHGGFRSDQLVLRAAHVPEHIRFADTLMVSRIHLYLPRYTLSALHEHFGLGCIECPHNALADALALKKILDIWKPPLHLFVTYAPKDYALSNYSGIGAKTELRLAHLGFSLSDQRTWGCIAYLLPRQRINVWNVCRHHGGTQSTPDVYTDDN